MSTTLWVNSDEGIDLGDFFTLMGDFAAMGKVCGEKSYARYAEMFGVPEASGSQEPCDPHWLNQVKSQAKEFLSKYGPKLTPRARRRLEQLSS